MPNKFSDNIDDQCMKGFRQGNEKSFEIIFRALYSALCFYSFRMTGSLEDAQDIAEESFIKVWERRGQFAQFQVLKSYLYSTVRNASLDWIKKQKAGLMSLDHPDVTSLTAPQTKLERIIEAEVFRELSHSFESLPGQRKKIIEMIFFEGRNTREVAAAMGLSPSTVKTQKSKAIAYLKKRIISIRSLI